MQDATKQTQILTASFYIYSKYIQIFILFSVYILIKRKTNESYNIFFVR